MQSPTPFGGGGGFAAGLAEEWWLGAQSYMAPRPEGDLEAGPHDSSSLGPSLAAAHGPERTREGALSGYHRPCSAPKSTQAPQSQPAHLPASQPPKLCPPSPPSISTLYTFGCCFRSLTGSPGPSLHPSPQTHSCRKLSWTASPPWL